MPETPDDKKQAIRDLRAAGWSKTKTSQAVGVSDQTVDKYEPEDVEGYDEDLDPSAVKAAEDISPELNPAEVLTEEYIPENVSSESGTEFTGTPPGESPLRDEGEKQTRVLDDYSETSPGSFIRGFFEDLEVGVRDAFVDLQARRAERRAQIPNEEKMRSDLLNMSSGVSNEREVGYIAEEYWAEAERYIPESKYDVSSKSRDGQGGGQGAGTLNDQGEFVAPGQQPGQQGEWMEIPGEGMVYGRMVKQPDGSKRFERMQPPSQQPQSPHGGQMRGGGRGGPSPEVQMLREEIRSLRQDVGGGSDGGGLRENIDRLLEMKQALAELEGEEDTDEQTQQAFHALNQQIQEIREEMANGQSSGGDLQDPREKFMERALTDDSIDTQTAMALADKFEKSKPSDVRKKEIDRDLELKRMEESKERTKALMDGFETIAQNITATLASSLSEGGDGASAQSGGGEANQPTQRESESDGQQSTPERDDSATTGGGGSGLPSADDGMFDCPSCGAETPIKPGVPGAACDECDHSIRPCPDCAAPVEVPPPGGVPTRMCPDCGEVAEPVEGGEDGEYACRGCDFEGDISEVGSEVIVCNDCGATHNVGRQVPAQAAVASMSVDGSEDD